MIPMGLGEDEIVVLLEHSDYATDSPDECGARGISTLGGAYPPTPTPEDHPELPPLPPSPPPPSDGSDSPPPLQFALEESTPDERRPVLDEPVAVSLQPNLTSIRMRMPPQQEGRVKTMFSESQP